MSKFRVPVITIDGPGGSGKGTIGLWLARKKGWHFLDSGVLYRLVAYAVQKGDLPLADEATLADLAAHLEVRFSVPNQVSEAYRIFYKDIDVTYQIREESVASIASKVAAIQAVRLALLERQRAFCVSPGLVADGRDMGTVVFPDAQLKVYLIASAEERAKRRYKQLKGKGISATLSAILADIKERDSRDITRSASPLTPAADAVIIDTTDLSVEKTEQKILDLVYKRFQ